MAQLAEWSPLATKIRSLNPTIEKLICLLHRIDEIKKKKPPHFFSRLSLIESVIALSRAAMAKLFPQCGSLATTKLQQQVLVKKIGGSWNQIQTLETLIKKDMVVRLKS